MELLYEEENLLRTVAFKNSTRLHDWTSSKVLILLKFALGASFW
jgi:hypothetical protein